MKQIRILLADDHPNVRTQIRARLDRESDFEVVGEAENSAQVIEYALTNRPNIVLIDPILRDGQGMQALRQVLGSIPETVIVVLTAFADTALQMELHKAGVRRILTKGVDSQLLVDTLHEVVQENGAT